MNIGGPGPFLYGRGGSGEAERGDSGGDIDGPGASKGSGGTTDGCSGDVEAVKDVLKAEVAEKTEEV